MMTTKEKQRESNTSIEKRTFPSPGGVSCSICLDSVESVGERSIARLKCGHLFHLDCIGSAFNAKGAMQCPNCRQVEGGQWLFAGGCFLQQHVLRNSLLEGEPDRYPGVQMVYTQDGRFDLGARQPPQGAYRQQPYSHGENDQRLPLSSYSYMGPHGRHHQRPPWLLYAENNAHHNTSFLPVASRDARIWNASSTEVPRTIGSELEPSYGLEMHMQSLPPVVSRTYDWAHYGNQDNSQMRWINEDGLPLLHGPIRRPVHGNEDASVMLNTSQMQFSSDFRTQDRYSSSFEQHFMNPQYQDTRYGHIGAGQDIRRIAGNYFHRSSTGPEFGTSVHHDSMNGRLTGIYPGYISHSNSWNRTMNTRSYHDNEIRTRFHQWL